MAMNPMQRKIRNSFLFGFLVAVIVAAVVIGLLFMKIKGLNQELDKKADEYQVSMTSVYVVSKDVKEGENIELKQAEVLAKYVPEDAIKTIPDEFMDEEGNLKMVAVVDLKENTIITPNLVSADKGVASYRTVEFNSIDLPSRLTAGEYADIRLQIVDTINNLDYVVLSKVLVEDCTASTVWFKLTEGELQVLDCAVVESYAIEGARLYATQYSSELEPKIAETYVPTEEVMNFIKVNSDLPEKDADIADRFERDKENAERNGGLSVRDQIELIISGQDDALSAARAGLQAEKTSIKAAREAIMGEDN